MAGNIYVTGDMHGDIIPSLSFSKNPFMRRLDERDVLVVCGDIGIMWPGYEKEGKYTLDWLAKQKYTIVFIRGNHDNEPWWSAQEPSDGNGKTIKLVMGDLRQVRDNVFLVTNSTIVDLCGHRCLCIGGAVSTDANNLAFPHETKLIRSWKRSYEYYRIVGKSWFPGEGINIAYLKSLLNNYRLRGEKYSIEYIFSHQAPSSYCDSGFCYRIDRRIPCEEQELLQEIFLDNKWIDFVYWYHGHMHDDIQWHDKISCVFLDTVCVTRCPKELVLDVSR